ncbi:MAG: cyclase [Flavobacteriales bacterium]|nr:cyclase [Flavobacteriales bacterium]
MINSNRWKYRPQGSNWGEYGEDDQLGRLNLVDEKKVLQAVHEIKTGKSFCLSLPLDLPGGQALNKVRKPPILKPVIRNNEEYYNYRWDKIDERITDVGSDDLVILHTQYSTQWDSLAHRGSVFDIQGNGIEEVVYYNGFKADDYMINESGDYVKATKLGIENAAMHGIQGRGVLVDLYRECKESEAPVGYDQLMNIFDKQNVEIETGDMLCLWTGMDNAIIKSKGNPSPEINLKFASLNGWDEKLLNWITDSGVAVLISDNLAVEKLGVKIPESYKGPNLPLHEHCLFKLGIHLGELWYLKELAQWLKKNNRNRFMLTAPPLRLPGAVGSPVTPIATV